MKQKSTGLFTCLMLLMLLLLLLALPLQAQSQEPRLIAGQGQAGDLPPQSLAAITLAAALGCDGVSLNLVLTQNNQVLILTDIDLKAVSNVTTLFPDRGQEDQEDNSFPVFDLSLDELRQLTWQGSSGYHHTPVPLSEVLALQRTLKDNLGHDLLLNLELRQPWKHRQADLDLTRAVLDTLQMAGHTGRTEAIRLQSYDHEELRRLRLELLPEYGLDLDLIQLIGDNNGQEAQVEQWGTLQPYNYDWMLSRSGLRLLATLVQGIGLDKSQLISAAGAPLLTDYLADLKTLGLNLQIRDLKQDHSAGNVQDLTRLADLLPHLTAADSLITDNCSQLVRARRQRLLAPQPHVIPPPTDLMAPVLSPGPVPLPISPPTPVPTPIQAPVFIHLPEPPQEQ
ncbi:MAG: hypothetical protein H8E79_07510 [Desulfobulbaceae bacterium]|uniref:glycerophosphodiester phosphodiesterase n=1 Tax=Candidatus Desulfatifera sulfidica TaxID=2841691 RepID=A0A8J6N8T4_9BACT|nr:hypothetical protein [Candidatus Desulfatifera sulfidica]